MDGHHIGPPIAYASLVYTLLRRPPLVYAPLAKAGTAKAGTATEEARDKARRQRNRQAVAAHKERQRAYIEKMEASHQYKEKKV